MIRTTTATALLIWLIILISCSENKTQIKEQNKFKELELKPMTLVIDEVSCKQCVKDMAEKYAKNPVLSEVVFLSADAFGRTTLDIDSSVKTYARRDFGSEANKLGSFLINQSRDTIKLDVNNYKQVLESLSVNPN
jgi:hypothetical protein